MKESWEIKKSDLSIIDSVIELMRKKDDSEEFLVFRELIYSTIRNNIDKPNVLCNLVLENSKWTIMVGLAGNSKSTLSGENSKSDDIYHGSVRTYLRKKKLLKINNI